VSAIRQDAWTEQDDRMLAEVTIRHIKEGGTQLSAFAEVGQQIGRTQAACGFRWNSFLRKQYEQDIRQAKMQRQRAQLEKRKLTISKEHTGVERRSYKSPDGTTFLQLAEQMQQWLNKLRELDLQLASSTAEVERLRKENEDYRVLLQLLDKARAMSVQL
jgi:prespore-specific regulator